MLNLLLWTVTFLGLVGLVLLAWRSAMRRRGFHLLKLLEKEQIVRYAVDVPVVVGQGVANARTGLLTKRGTVVLTRKRLAGFAHRARFVLVREGGSRSGAVKADGSWLLVRPGGRRRDGSPAPVFGFQLPDAEGWSRDARTVLRM